VGLYRALRRWPAPILGLLIACGGETRVPPLELVSIDVEPAGPNCTFGGLVVRAGPDQNADGVLAAGEVSSTSFACNAPPAAGVLQIASPEPPGSNCAVGGVAVEAGLDTNGDGVLAPSEVTSTTYACSGPSSLGQLVVPGQLPFVEGRSQTLYFDNLLLPPSAGDYVWDVTGVAQGAQCASGWTWTPSATVSQTPLTVGAFDPISGTRLGAASTLISAAPASAGAGTTLRCIFIGDSLTSAGAYTQELLNISSQDALKLELRGTVGVAPNLYEARGGWRVRHYTTDFVDSVGRANPFWIDGRVDFPGYLVAGGIGEPDWVFILLGTNDAYSSSTDAEALAVARSAFDALDALLSSVLSSGPRVRVGLLTPPPPNQSQDAFAADYGSGQTRWRFKRNILIWDRELIARYGATDRILVVPTHVALDTATNMVNGAHPSSAGYRQLAEVVWAFLKNHTP
jgi:hypothetical protein